MPVPKLDFLSDSFLVSGTKPRWERINRESEVSELIEVPSHYIERHYPSSIFFPLRSAAVALLAN